MEKNSIPVFDISIVTNGSLLTNNIADYFKKNRVKVTISLDGMGKFNDLTRKLPNGSGTYELAKKGAQIAKKQGILSGINVTITSENIAELPFLVKYCLKNRMRMRLSIVRQFKTILNSGEKIENIKEFVLHYKKILETIYSYYAKGNILHSPLLDHRLLDDLKYPNLFQDRHCEAGSTYFSVTPEGNLQFCPASQLYVASIHDTNFIQKARLASAPILKRSSVEKIQKCTQCLWKYICMGGCMLERLGLHKNINNPTYKCDIYKKLMPIILDLEAKRIIKKNFFDGHEIKKK